MSKILCAAADKLSADRLKVALGPLGDVAVLIASAALADDRHKDTITRQALDALGRDKLVIVQIDDTPPPLGLRDVPRCRWSPDAADATTQAAAIAAAVRTAKDRAPTTDLRAPPARPRISIYWTVVGLLLAVIVAALLRPFIEDLLQPVSLEPETSLRSDFVGGVDEAAWALRNIQIMVGVILVIQVLTLLVGMTRWLLALLRRRRQQRFGDAEADTGAVRGLLFASYSRQDREHVDALIADIEREGLPVWLDRVNIGGGTTWPEAIVQAIKSARALIIFCSPHAFESDNVLREVNLAAEYKKPILPIMLEPVQMPDSFHYYLSTRQIISITDDPQWRGKVMDALKQASQAA